MPSITSEHSIVKDEFPIVSILKEVSILEDQEFAGDELCCDRITYQLILRTLTETI